MGRYDRSKDVLHKGQFTKGRVEDYQWLVEKPEDSNIRTFKVTSATEGRSDRIAQILYGNSELYWVIVSFNARWYSDSSARNVFDWPKSGSVIYYPTFEIITSSLV